MAWENAGKGRYQPTTPLLYFLLLSLSFVNPPCQLYLLQSPLSHTIAFSFCLSLSSPSRCSFPLSFSLISLPFITYSFLSLFLYLSSLDKSLCLFRTSALSLSSGHHLINMPSHLKISGGPKMARAALSRRAIDGPCAVM